MLMQIDGTFIFVAISFLIFLFIIKAILYRPITKVLDERNKFYEKNSKMELQSKEKSKNLLNEKEEMLKNARIEAANIVSNASADAKNKSESDIKKTKKDALEKIENDKNTLLEESKKAKEEARSEISNLVSIIAQKVMNEDIEINLDEEKINEYLKI